MFRSQITGKQPKRNHSFEEPEDLLQGAQQCVIGSHAGPVESSLFFPNPLWFQKKKKKKMCKFLVSLKIPTFCSVTYGD